MSWRFRKILIGGCGGLTLYAAYKYKFSKNDQLVLPEHVNSKPKPPLPTRDEQLKALQSQNEYDILVIGGGATGSGVALDSVSRGLKTALVELDDFSSGTSSRSTKLIHGGVRYLQKAILQFDFQQYRMVKEALQERSNLLANAPHLVHLLPIMLPIYNWWKVPYYWVGIKAYDFVAGKHVIKTSYFQSRDKALEAFPMLRKDNLCGALIYYDGQHDDARMNLALIVTSARLGANIANHVAVTKLIKTKNSEGEYKLSGASVKDMLTGDEWNIYAKCVINATGPFTDSVRRMDDGACPLICQPSSGVHIVLPEHYSPENMGLLDPAASDGRVIFFLPWQKKIIVGTTDRPCDVTYHPSPREEDIEYILNNVKRYLNPEITLRSGDVLSAWSGIRPLVLNPNKISSESLARNHVVDISDSNLITITGGKWTTYRLMAQEAVDSAVDTCNLKSELKCQTGNLMLEGASGWTPIMYIKLVQDYGFEIQVARHLADTYGDQAFAVAKLAKLSGKRWPIMGRRLHEQFPYIEAEIRYAISEYACTAVDVMARRLRLSFLNVRAAEEALPSIISIMTNILKWDQRRQEDEHKKAMEFLRTEMGLSVILNSRVKKPSDFSKDEVEAFIKQFQSIDKGKKGYVPLDDLGLHLKARGENMDDQTLYAILREVDLEKNGRLDMHEYLHLMAVLRAGVISKNKLATALNTVECPYEDSSKAR